jgi:hypothetical protein
MPIWTDKHKGYEIKYMTLEQPYRVAASIRRLGASIFEAPDIAADPKEEARQQTVAAIHVKIAKGTS